MGLLKKCVHYTCMSGIMHIPDSKVHGANMGPTWGLSAPDGPHVGPMNLAIRDGSRFVGFCSDLIKAFNPCPSGSLKQSYHVVFWLLKWPWRTWVKRFYQITTKPNETWTIPDSKVHGANMGPIWGRQDPGGPHVGPMNFAIRDVHNSWQCLWSIMLRCNVIWTPSQYKDRLIYVWRFPC